VSTPQTLLAGPASQPPPAAARVTSRGRRAAENLCFVAAWIGIAWLLGLGFIGFLLLGAPLAVAFQAAVRRPLRHLWARDTATFARNRKGKLLVAAVLLGVPGWLLLQTVPVWLDHSWTVLLLAATLALAYLLLRRLLVSVVVAAAAVAVAMSLLSPQLADDRNGDSQLLAKLDGEQNMGMLAGYRDLAVAEVDLNSAQPVRLAGRGARSTTPMEIGSLTKALTGLVVADSVQRGELRMDSPVSKYLPQLAGSAAGQVSMRELVTHTAGYTEFGSATTGDALWRGPLGRRILTDSRAQLFQQVREGDLASRGSYRYSTLGAATAGQAAAAAAGMSYPDLMRTRLFAPLGMTDTAIQADRPLVGRGRTASGLPVQPWVMHGYAPGGAAVSTTRDLARLATALLHGTAPGLDALTPSNVQTTQDITHVGVFWQTSAWQNGQTITWHNGETGGYSSYFGLDLQHRTAVIVLSDVAADDTTDLGIRLLARSS
jgi:CubicO group peptidase (beta-lactamase class C family)